MQPLVPPSIVVELARRVRDRGGRALLVGGCVRDHLMGLPIKDWDIEVFGLDVDALEATLRTLGRVDTVGRAFSVLKLHHKGLALDVSLPRRDSKQGPGHRGILALGDPTMTPEEAVRRRDLTVNAILFDPLTAALVDPARGREDLAAGRLAPVDPHTFLEDPLRALRAVQFAARFGFTATDTLEALCRAAPLEELPPERVLGEVEKLLLKGRHLAHGLALARRTGVLERLLPELAAAPQAHDRRLDAALPLRDTLGDPPRQLALMLAVWASSATGVEGLLDRLRLHRWLGFPVREVVLALHAHALDPVGDDAALRWLSTRVEVDLALRVREVVVPDPSASALRARAAALGVLHLPPPRWVQGRDLSARGVAPGPRMGALVNELYAAQLDGRLADREEALALAARMITRAAGSDQKD